MGGVERVCGIGKCGTKEAQMKAKGDGKVKVLRRMERKQKQMSKRMDIGSTSPNKETGLA